MSGSDRANTGEVAKGRRGAPPATDAATEAERPMTLATDQARDGLVHVALGPGLRARLLSRRCREADAQDLPNQDYALVRGAPGGRSLAFCVCDGVGSSYKGDFAAAYLAPRLVDWLAALPPPDAATADGAREDEAALRARLTSELQAWSRAGQEELRRLAIPDGAGGLVREVLEELREGYGSEAVFLAGRVDLPGDPAHLLLCWMDNVTARVFGAAGRAEPRGVPGDDGDRWSTARGPRGALRVASSVAPSPLRLIVHTDGADGLGDELAALTDDALRERVGRLRESAGSDDVTILDIRWGDPGDAAGAG